MSEAPETVPRFPLAWPIGWKRTPPRQRKRATFSQSKTVVSGQTSYKRAADLTTAVAVKRLQDQLDRLGAIYPTLSTNVPPRLDGWPASRDNPADPGAACYFLFRKKATVLACDQYDTVADNIAALAAHIDALRRIERHGVGTIEQALAGYRALPADSAADWRHVFGFAAGERVTIEALTDRYRERARTSHPDVGGSDVEMAHVNRAREFALAELSA